jgi:N-acylneuraminate cytidylyltransferase
MIAGEPVLALIPARGGSKGLPGKNLRPFAGKPLLDWTIAAAKASAHVDRTVVSSDDAEILAAGAHAGAEALARPADLARDETPAEPVLRHALDALGIESGFAIWLQPTSPLRTHRDIDEGLKLCRETGATTAVSVTEAAKPPAWMFALENDGRMRRLAPLPAGAVRRQDLPRAFALNGAVYVARVSWLLGGGALVNEETRAFAMPGERSVDIDTMLDFQFAEILARDDAGGRA